MDKSANQSRLSRSQLPPQEAGNVALSLDQLTDLDQAISFSRGETPASTPAPTPVKTSVSAKAAKTTKPAQPTRPAQPAKPTNPPIKPAPKAPESPVIPVRSAKDAINAMYASENPARLSDYLSPSAKEVINATARPMADSKSAASLHHASSSQHRLETTRPSASSLFRAAKSEKTVVRTSLELDPKPLPRRAQNSQSVAPSSATRSASSPVAKPASKPSPIVINSRPRAEKPNSASSEYPQTQTVRPKKGRIQVTSPSPTAVAVATIEQAADAVARPAKTIAKTSAVQSAAGRSTKSAVSKSVPRPPRPARRSGLVQDIARPASSATTVKNPATAPAASARRPSRAPHLAKSPEPTSDPYRKLPVDSVKRRFRLAPKGFAASKPEQARPARRKFMSFSNPDYTVPVPKPSPAVEIYGLTEPEPEERNKDGLGVVEDYRPASPANPAMNTAASDRAAAHDVGSDSFNVPGAASASADTTSAGASAKSSKSAPDNNRYALGGQSPFFLKSVSVEKRPLSDAPTRRSDTISPIYTDPGDEVPRKNVYDGKSKPAKPTKSSKKANPRDLPQRPTVIIPSNRRSHTPLFLLLILTVILGAAVGAAVYFFFFQ